MDGPAAPIQARAPAGARELSGIPSSRLPEPTTAAAAKQDDEWQFIELTNPV